MEKLPTVSSQPKPVAKPATPVAGLLWFLLSLFLDLVGACIHRPRDRRCQSNPALGWHGGQIPSSDAKTLPVSVLQDATGIIRLTAILYVQFPMSFRVFADLLQERGVAYESVLFFLRYQITSICFQSRGAFQRRSYARNTNRDMACSSFSLINRVVTNGK